MSDLLNTTAIPGNDAPEVKIIAPGVSGIKKPRVRTAAAKPAALAMPKAPAANASDAEFTRYMREMRDYRAAVKASMPKRTKAPVISNKVKAAFFTMDGGNATSEQVAKKTASKLSTVKTFRGDAVNTLAVLADLPGSWLGADAKRWLAANRKK